MPDFEKFLTKIDLKFYANQYLGPNKRIADEVWIRFGDLKRKSANKKVRSSARQRTWPTDLGEFGAVWFGSHGGGQAQNRSRFVFGDPHSVFSGAPCSSFHSADEKTGQNAMSVRHYCREELRKVLSKYIRFCRYKPTLNAE